MGSLRKGDCVRTAYLSDTPAGCFPVGEVVTVSGQEIEVLFLDLCVWEGRIEKYDATKLNKATEEDRTAYKKHEMCLYLDSMGRA